MSRLTIGNLAAAAATKVQTIRYYEDIGLLKHFARTEGGHRIYGHDDRQRLSFIRHARELGFSIESIRELLDLADDPGKSCEAVDSIAQRQLDQVEYKIKKLRALRKELRRMLDECSHKHVGECRVIEVLGDHRQCAGDH